MKEKWSRASKQEWRHPLATLHHHLLVCSLPDRNGGREGQQQRDTDPTWWTLRAKGN